MIAMDNQPFSIVEDQGFIELLAELKPKYVNPSTKYFNETMLQQAQAYDSLKLKLLKSCHILRLCQAILLLKTSSVPCIIHTLALVTKDSLFEDNNIKLLLEKIQKLVCHFSHSFKKERNVKKIQIIFTTHKRNKKSRIQDGTQQILCQRDLISNN